MFPHLLCPFLNLPSWHLAGALLAVLGFVLITDDTSLRGNLGVNVSILTNIFGYILWR
jgi:hypothetical protein